MNHENARNGFGLSVSILIIACALLGAGVAYYAIREQARRAESEADHAREETEHRATLMQEERHARMMDRAEILVVLDEQNKSRESGNATTSAAGGKVAVAVYLKNGPKNTAQPAHIHAGSCKDLGAVKYPLGDVVGGNLETTLEVSFEDFMKELPLAINVHQSAANAQTYVACGMIDVSQMKTKAMNGMILEGGNAQGGTNMMEGEGGMRKKDQGATMPH